MNHAKIITLNILSNQLTVFALAGLIVMLLGSYVFLVNSSVFNIVAREDALDQATNLESELATLETRYIELSSQITLPVAYEQGYRDASKEAVFVKASDEATDLSFANEI